MAPSFQTLGCPHWAPEPCGETSSSLSSLPPPLPGLAGITEDAGVLTPGWSQLAATAAWHAEATSEVLLRAPLSLATELEPESELFPLPGTNKGLYLLLLSCSDSHRAVTAGWHSPIHSSLGDQLSCGSCRNPWEGPRAPPSTPEAARGSCGIRPPAQAPGAGRGSGVGPLSCSCTPAPEEIVQTLPQQVRVTVGPQTKGWPHF